MTGEANGQVEATLPAVTHTHTHRHTQTHKHTHTDRHRHRHRHTHTHRHRHTHTQADRQTDTRTRTQTQAHAHIHAQQVALTPSLQPQSASWRLQPCLRSSRLYFCFVVCLFVCLVNVCFVLVFSSLSLTQTHAHSHSLFVTCVCAARNWRSRAETRGTKATDKNHNTDT